MWTKRKCIKAMQHAKGHIANAQDSLDKGLIEDIKTDLDLAFNLLHNAINEEKFKKRVDDKGWRRCLKA